MLSEAVGEVETSPGRVHCEISAEGTGRAPTTKMAPKCKGARKGSCRGISTPRAPDARLATSNIVCGRQPSQPRRRYDVAVWKRLATPEVTD